MAAIGPSPEMYLKSAFELSHGDNPVSIGALAGRLGVTPVSASEMVHRLERRKLVVHRRYRGVRLTAAGRRHALALIRRHRLWECFLHDELGLPWETVHEPACELEHAAPDSVTEALADRLGHPARCPHGNPIPDPHQRIESDPSVCLASLPAGAAGRLLSVAPETSSTLSYLAAHGFRPGRKFEIERVEPTDRLLVVRHEGGTITIGPELAAHLHVLPAGPARGLR